LITFDKEGRPTLGVRRTQDPHTFIDLSIAAPWLPQPLIPLLTAGETAIAQVKAALAHAPSRAVVPIDSIKFFPPVTHPGKVLCLGLNYAAHAEEGRFERPSSPVLFTRVATSLVGHQEPLIRPQSSEQLDYEGELAIIIGRRGRHVSRVDALSLVGGYSIFNDGSVRDYQFSTPQWTMGKNFDSTGAFGPDCVTPDELPAGAAGLRLQTRLNGELVQDANTKDMLFDVADTIAFVTQAITLQVGDVLVMGTPAGVGWARVPQRFMKPGDVCEVDIEGIGTLCNPIVDEQITPYNPSQGLRR
jgi:2-keto-4-pentenoate hydratase/2-oxohepta-3-ene-1,7-dioic acid hydratase in catechol pathway